MNDERRIDVNGMTQYTSDFKSQAEELLTKYDSISRALDDTSGIKGHSEAALHQAKEEVASIKAQLEGIVNGYFNYLQENVPNIEGLDKDGQAQLASNLDNLSKDFKNKRSGGGGGSSGGSGSGGMSGGSSGGSTGGGSTGGAATTPSGGSSANPSTQTTSPTNPNENGNNGLNPFKPNNDSSKNKTGGDATTKSNDIDAKIKEIQDKMRQMQDDIRKKQQKGDTGLTGKQGIQGTQGKQGAQGLQGYQGRQGYQGQSGRDGTSFSTGGSRFGGTGGLNGGGSSFGGSSQSPSYTPSTGSIPSTGTNFGTNGSGSGTTETGSDLGTTSRDKDDLGKMSTGNEEENPNLENGEVIEEGKLSDVAPSDDLSDGNLELGATDDNLVPEDKKGNNNLLKFAGIGGMLLGSGALAAGLATKKDEEELSAEEETGDELEDEYSQELKDFYE